MAHSQQTDPNILTEGMFSSMAVIFHPYILCLHDSSLSQPKVLLHVQSLVLLKMIPYLRSTHLLSWGCLCFPKFLGKIQGLAFPRRFLIRLSHRAVHFGSFSVLVVKWSDPFYLRRPKIDVEKAKTDCLLCKYNLYYVLTLLFQESFSISILIF